MRTTTIMLGLGLAGCVGYLLLQDRLSPPPLKLRPALPSTTVAAAADTVPVTIDPPTATIDDVGPENKPRRRRPTEDTVAVSRFQQQLQTLVDSADSADQPAILALLAEWVRSDPAAAAHFARSLPVGTWWRADVLRYVAQDWAEQDPLSATNWAAGLRNPSERNASLSGVCLTVARTNPRLAAEMAERDDLESLPGAVTENIVQQWAAQDLPGAVAWVTAHPPGEQRDQMLERLAFVQSETEPAAAASLVVDQIPTGPIQEDAAISVLRQWATRDLTAATAWVNRFPPGALRDRAEAELRGSADQSP